jgi:hypothetical protein
MNCEYVFEIYVQFYTDFLLFLPGACTIKLFTAVIYGFSYKLECLALVSLSS